MLKFKHKGKGLETYQKAEREEYERAINQDIQKSKNFVCHKQGVSLLFLRKEL